MPALAGGALRRRVARVRRLREPWELRSPADWAAAEQLMKRLAAVVGGDPQVCDVARILRLPGTLNLKGGTSGRAGRAGQRGRVRPTGHRGYAAGGGGAALGAAADGRTPNGGTSWRERGSSRGCCRACGGWRRRPRGTGSGVVCRLPGGGASAAGGLRA
ncbi:MAG: RepB family DNA primase [Gammaproteobacteria bacterium]|nr:RepB family DNA primase [Gammaproteobacteria bacterium]